LGIAPISGVGLLQTEIVLNRILLIAQYLRRIEVRTGGDIGWETHVAQERDKHGFTSFLDLNMHVFLYLAVLILALGFAIGIWLHDRQWPVGIFAIVAVVVILALSAAPLAWQRQKLRMRHSHDGSSRWTESRTFAAATPTVPRAHDRDATASPARTLLFSVLT
jgi:hypothetical protein